MATESTKEPGESYSLFRPEGLPVASWHECKSHLVLRVIMNAPASHKPQGPTTKFPFVRHTCPGMKFGLPLLLNNRIPLDRGRQLAVQYGIAPLLSPLFDFTPNQQAMSGLPSGFPSVQSLTGRGIPGSPSYGGTKSSFFCIHLYTANAV